ncbi:AfsR/SARP family transcriptional regulator [Nocardiopsis potens]|uniref:AfsR/SARP family transcriptional regulator n=1 Tax=Nocardiopsis potens TaxID=1246458 RepID=UPI000349A852|nr:BTAD domain-containing putative transcriptional regulator [Nocardiopsis potens]
MRFGILGPLEVRDGDGALVPVPGTRVRTLLAVLLLDRGRTVSADRLVEDVWGDSPPADPAGVLQARISDLRRALERGAPGGRALIRRSPPGYLADIAPDRLDADRFTALTRQAREEEGPGRRAALLTDALALWRGPALADFADEPFAPAAAARLEERRIIALEEQAEARLELGDHADLAADLADPVRLHPFRERLRAAHIRALYRSGRQTEALASYEDLRTRLADDLGLDPGPDLAALHQAVLEQSPSLAPPPRAPTDREAPRPAAPTGPGTPAAAPGTAPPPEPARREGEAPATPLTDLPSGPATPAAEAETPTTPAPNDSDAPAAGPAGVPPQARASDGSSPPMAEEPPAGADPGAPLPAPDGPGRSGLRAGAAADGPITASATADPGTGVRAGGVPAPGRAAVAASAPGPAGAPPSAPVGPGAGAGVSGPPPAVPRSGLPAPIGPFIGRAGEVARVRALLATERLVTLTGPGGVGKTRLSVETAAEAAADFPGGVHLVELAPVAPGGDPAERTAAVLGLRDTGADPAAPIAEALAHRRALLVLDNCEHLVDAVAGLAARLLAAAPELHILATGREPLRVSGERVRPVAPLGLPAAGADRDLGVLRQAAAARFFEARASAAAPGYTLTAADAGPVARICRRLDGIPLALELAATRVRAMAPSEIADRLDDRFRLLTSGSRAAPERQRTLRAAIDWSWDLLTGPERAVLRRLSVHPDGCTLEAAEEVCSGGGVDRADVLDLLALLVDRSLAVPAHTPVGTRYRLLESVAAYARDRLAEAGETEEARRRHALYHADLAGRAEDGVRGREQCAWLERAEAAAPDLRAALDHAVGAADAELALRLANAAAWPCHLRGRSTEAARHLTAALGVPGGSASARSEARAWLAGLYTLGGRTEEERPEPRSGTAPSPGEAAAADRGTAPFPEEAEPLRAAGDSAAAGTGGSEPRRAERWRAEGVADPVRRARVECFLAFAEWGLGDLAEAERRTRDLLAGCERRGDRWGTAAASSVLALDALIRADLAAARTAATRAAELFGALGDRWGVLQASDVLGQVAEITGDHAGAEQVHRDGLKIAEELGMWSQVSLKLSGLGRLALLAGDLERAAELHERALEVAADHSDESGRQFAEAGLGLVARRAGRLDEAERHVLGSLDRNREEDGRIGLAFISAELGFIAEQRGDADRALALHTDGLAAARSTGDPRAVALALEGLAGAHSLAGRPLRAARLLGRAAALRSSAGAPLPAAERFDTDRIEARIRTALGGAGFTAAFREGRDGEPAEEERRP